MEVIVSNPVEVFQVKFNPNDSMSEDLSWIRYKFDKETYHLLIETSNGESYESRWSITESEPFMELVVRFDEEYLLNKISDRSIVDSEAVKKNLIEAIEIDVSDKERATALIKSLDNYKLNSEEEILKFFHATNEFNDCSVYEFIEFDFPQKDKNIVEVFEKFIKIQIKNKLFSTAQFFISYDYAFNNNGRIDYGKGNCILNLDSTDDQNITEGTINSARDLIKKSLVHEDCPSVYIQNIIPLSSVERRE